MKNLHFILLGLTLFLVACQTSSSGGTTTPFVGGIDGVDVTFVTGAPPSEVFDDGEFPFDIIIRLHNKGEEKVEVGEVRLSGISRNDFGGPGSYTKSIPEVIESVKKDTQGNKIEGGVTFVEFKGFNFGKTLQGNTQFRLRADVCYKYKTKSSVLVCIQENLLTIDRDEICDVSGSKSISSSGSPIQIESFQQRPAGNDRISFTFVVSHKGSGLVHSGNLCSNEFADKNKVHLKVTPSSGSVTCSSLGGGSEGDVRLDSGKRAIECFLNIGTSSTFETPLTIEANFNYRIHEDTSILVKHFG